MHQLIDQRPTIFARVQAMLADRILLALLALALAMTIAGGMLDTVRRIAEAATTLRTGKYARVTGVTARDELVLKLAGMSRISSSYVTGNSRAQAAFARDRARRSSFGMTLPYSSRGVKGVRFGSFHVPRSIWRLSNSTLCHLSCVILRFTSLTNGLWCMTAGT